jgi:hypothetical protein
MSLLLLMSGCRAETLRLGYQFAPGTILKYQMHASATANWNIGSPGQGSYEVAFEVVEAVQSVDDTGAVVAVSMTPLSTTSAGLPAPGPDARSFTLEVGQNGEVRKVLEVDGISAQELDPNDVAFIGTYRPPLPLEEVEIRGSWSSSQQVEVGSVVQELATLGTLMGVGRDGDGTTATMAYKGSGPVTWKAALPQGAADLSGIASTSSRAVLDVDGGFLRTAASTTSGDFTVEVIPEGGGDPVDGDLHLELVLNLRKV